MAKGEADVSATTDLTRLETNACSLVRFAR